MTDRRFGGFWRRLLAYFIDKLILYFIALLLLLIGLLTLSLGGGVSFGRIAMTGALAREMGLFVALYVATTILVGMVYFIWFHGTVGQTPGKMLLGLRVIQTSGEKMTLGIAFLRWVGSLVSRLALWFGFIWIAFDGRKQGWHDKIAATLVVHIQHGPAADAPDDEDASPFSTPATGPMPTAVTDPLPPSPPKGGITELVPEEAVSPVNSPYHPEPPVDNGKATLAIPRGRTSPPPEQQDTWGSDEGGSWDSPPGMRESSPEIGLDKQRDIL